MSREAALKFYERLEADRTLQEVLEALGDPERIARHVREERGYRFTREEMRQVICERNRDLSDEELEAVVGGLGVGDWIAMGIAGGSVAITLVLTGAAFAVAAA